MKALCFLTLLLAAGCTKESEPVVRDEAAPLRPAPVRTDPRPVIAVVGDSLAEGLGVDPEQNFPALLQREIDRRGYRYRVANLGISGDTTTGGLGRIDAAIALRPAIVMLELGGNDGLRGVPVASTRANLEAMIGRVKAAGGRVLLAGMSLPPNYGPEYIRSFERVYRDVAKKHDVPLIPFLFEDLVPRLRAQPDLLQRDGVHPTAAGHRVLAATVMRYLEPLLEK